MSAMDRGPLPSSPAPARCRRFAGLRIAMAVALFSSLGGLGATAIAWGLERLGRDRASLLSEDVEQRIDAGRVSIAALADAARQMRAGEDALEQETRAAARNRASELVLLAMLSIARRGPPRLHGMDARTSGDASPPMDAPAPADAPAVSSFASAADLGGALPPCSPERGEHVGLLDRAGDRVLSFESLGLSSQGRLTSQLPAVASALKKDAQEGSTRTLPLVFEDEGGVWAFSPPFASGLLVAARTEIMRPPSSSDGLHRAASAIVALADPAQPIVPAASAIPILLLGMLSAALIGAIWAQWRVGKPIEETLCFARDFVHGDNAARAKETRGGRDARDVARAVNSLIERAERLKVQGSATRESDVRSAALAIEALGRGDLTRSAPVLSGLLEPIARAIDAARRDMLEHITEIHGVALQIASHAAGVAPGAKKIDGAALEQLEVLKSLSDGAGSATEEVKRAADQLAGDVEHLTSFVQEERRAIQDVRGSLRSAGRRVQDLRQGAARIEELVVMSEAMDDAMDLLAANVERIEGCGPGGRARVSTTLGEARAALDTITRELSLLRDEIGETAGALESIASSVPDSPADLERTITANLHHAAANLVRIAELTMNALRSLERAARATSEGAAQIHEGANAAAALVPRLGAVLAEFNLGTSFEDDLLERLERWRADVDKARTAPDGLTEDGRSMVKQVLEASEAARARLQRLVSAAEAAVHVLRG